MADDTVSVGSTRRDGWVAILLLGSALLMYVSCFPPKKLALDDTCAPKGVSARWKEFTIGSRFWESQLTYVDHEISAPARFKKAVAFLDSLTRNSEVRADSVMDSLYAQFPQLRPSAPPIPQQLRAIADSVEGAATMRLVDSIMNERALRFATCRHLVAVRAKR
jgi:hypothetical protein